MKTASHRFWILGALAFLATTLPGRVHGQANSWTNTVATGLWQDATKWSLLAAPTSTHTAVFITNATTKTVTINSATLPGNLTISNLTVRGFGAGINTLQLTNAPASTLLIRNALTIGTNAVLMVTNSALRVDGQLGGSFIVDGGVTNLAAGQILSTNLTIGSIATSRGNLTTLGELLQVSNSVVVGAVAGAQGTLTVAGGSNVFNFSMTVGQNVNATGAVWVTGGQLIVTNSTTATIVGSAGIGQMTVSNGNWRASGVRIGNAAGTRGVLTLAGGTNTLTSLTVGFNANATGTVWMTGGELVVTNASGSIQVGRDGVGQMTVSNGTVRVGSVLVGFFTGAQGTLTVAGGTNSIYTSLTLGASACDATGTVVVAGGQLFVTNASANAKLEVLSGSVTLNSGTLTINSLVITNACGRFLKTGGTLSVTTTNISANLDADADGLPNSWETSFGLSPFSDTGNDGASGDPDGDGFSNQIEFQDETNPTDSASHARDGYHTVNGQTTGGEGGPTVTVIDFATFSNYVNQVGSYNVQVQGTIVIPSNFNATVSSDKTIVGLGTDATLNGTLYISAASNVIVRNISITNPSDENGDGTDDEDGLSVIDDSHHVWIDHCTFHDCLDGELDITKGADFVTVSWCKFYYTTNTLHNFVNLIGHNDANGAQDTGKLHVTFHHNWWSTLCVERMPRARFGRIHSYNNYFNTSTNNLAILNNYCIRASISSEVYAVKNVFENVDEPFDYFAPDGLMLGVSNVFINCSNVISVNDPVFTPPYVYTLDETTDVPCMVTNSAGAGNYQPAVNSWIGGSGKWETVANWSLLVAPSLTDSENFITVAGNNTVTIDATTTNTPGTMTISNLVLAGFTCSSNTLVLNNAGTNTPLRILNAFTNGVGGVVSITNSALRVDGLGGSIYDELVNDGAISLNTGALVVSNTLTVIGSTGEGALTISNGLWLAQSVYMAYGSGGQGTLTVAGGTSTVSSTLWVGINNTATVWLVGGQLTMTNSSALHAIGNNSAGRMTVSNGTWRASGVRVGESSGSQGTVTIAGGTNLVGALTLGYFSSTSTGTVWMTGGQLFVTNTSSLVIIGNAGVGQMTVSNGIFRALQVNVANNFGSRGTLIIAGGTNTVLSTLAVGSSCSVTGTVIIDGGRLFVTNATTSAALDVRGGLVQFNSGTLTVNRLVVTNTCGHFVHSGGALTVGTLVLDPFMDADNDGLPNGWEQTFGLDPLDPTGDNGAAGNPDGDGLTNLQEYEGGTNPKSGTFIENSWITAGSGKWETNGHWSLTTAPSITNAADLITNAVTKTVTIDAVTTNLPGTMTISNLTVSAPAGSTNTLVLDTGGTNTPLRILNFLTLTSGGAIAITNSALRVDGLSGVLANDGTMVLNTGALTVSNTYTFIGNRARGALTVSNGTWLARQVFVGNNTNSSGTLTVAGGTNTLSSVLSLGYNAGATGTVWVTGGRLAVTNDNIEIGRFGVGEMTVSNAALLATDIYVGYLGGSQGTFRYAGGTNVLETLTVGLNGTGTAWMTGGKLTLTNSIGLGFVTVGGNNVGQMAISNATVFTPWIFVGGSGTTTNISALGTLTLAGATAVISELYVGQDGLATGTLWMTSSQLLMTNPATFANVGDRGIGSMTVSSGTWRVSDLRVGNAAGSQGTLTLAGGTNVMTTSLRIGSSAGVTGTVWLTGGQLTVTNFITSVVRIGESGVGTMTVSNGTLLGRVVALGVNAGARGSLTMAGGVTSVSSNLIVGNFACSSVGTVTVAGGSLFVTNATVNATLDVRSGTVTLNSGTLTINRLVITNACGRFVRTGGALSITATNISAAFDADGDGIPNGFDPSPFNPADTGDDPDGDGFTNLQEFQAGTNPTNSASYFHITSIVTTGADVSVTWLTGTAKTNALERTAGVGSSFSNSFAAIFTVTNTVGTSTNYLDLGAATNNPAQYYRVRLVP